MTFAIKCIFVSKLCVSELHLDTKKTVSTQDRSPFCILHIMNEILQHPEIMDTFLVGNHCHIFRKIIKSNVVNIL